MGVSLQSPIHGAAVRSILCFKIDPTFASDEILSESSLSAVSLRSS